MFLVDTNIWLELILDQKRGQEVRDFFQKIEGGEIAITEFSLYYIGIILSRLKKEEAYIDFISDALEDSGIKRIRLELPDLKQAILNKKKLNLDFDDAYQYTVARKFNLTLVNFDSDFDRTDLERKTPSQV